MDPDEEAQYAAEETERERHREQFERSKRSSRTPAIVEAAGQMIRTLSVSTSKPVHDILYTLCMYHNLWVPPEI